MPTSNLATDPVADPPTRNPLETCVAFVEAAAVDALGAIDRYLDPSATQEELPNRIHPAGASYDVAGMRAAALRGRALLASQRYEVVSALADGARVALELAWEGVLAVSAGALAPGARMTARIAMFFEVHGGRITRLRNYDAYDPW